MKKLATLLAGAALLLITASAMATPITGSIGFRGDIQLTGPESVTTLDNATGIDFYDPANVGRGATGSYAGILVNTEAYFTDFQFAPVLSPTSVDPLWTLTFGSKTFDFILNSVQASYGPNSLTLNGTGILRGTDYEDTLGTWSFTTQGGSGDLTFSATSAVPEPGTMLLLGAGFLGLAIYGKRRKNA